MRVVEVMDGASGSDGEPTWEEAVAAFGTGTPVELVRPARKIVIRYRYEDGRCYATSPDLTGFEIAGTNLYETRNLARKRLDAWLDPAVELDEIMPFGHILVAKAATRRKANAHHLSTHLRTWRIKVVNSLAVALLQAAERIIDSLDSLDAVQRDDWPTQSPRQRARPGDKTRR